MADDDQDVRELFELVLVQAGHDVTAIADGRAAVHAFRKDVFDLVLLGFSKPGLTGVEIARELRSKPGMRVPIILATASATDEDLAAADLAGVDESMSKPFSRAFLRERIAYHLQRPGHQRS